MGVVVYGTGHYRSVLGILKLSEILLALMSIILVAVHSWSGSLTKAFYAGTIIGIILSLIIFVLSSTEAGHSLNGVLRFQCYLWIILFIYIIIVSAIVTARSGSRTYRAGGVFGLFTSLVYLADSFISYKAYGNRLVCF